MHLLFLVIFLACFELRVPEPVYFIPLLIIFIRHYKYYLYGDIGISLIIHSSKKVFENPNFCLLTTFCCLFSSWAVIAGMFLIWILETIVRGHYHFSFLQPKKDGIHWNMLYYIKLIILIKNQIFFLPRIETFILTCYSWYYS